MHDVLIAGAGPAGLAAAAGFARSGRQVQVLDPAAAAPASRGRLYALNRPASRLLGSIAPDALRRACPIARMRVFARNGRPFEFSAAAAGMAALAATVLEDDLLAALRAAVDAAGASVAYGVRIESLQPLETGWLAAGGPMRCETRLLVAADGAASATASLAGVRSSPAGFGQRVWSGWLAAPAAEPGIARQWFADDGILALLPAPEGRWGFIWSEPAGLDRDRSVPDADFLRERISSICEPELGGCSFAGLPASFAVRPGHAPAAGRRIALVGDSVRALYPLAGQGLAIGLGDVAVLLDCCSSCGDPGVAAALGRYRRLRRLRSEAALQLTCLLARPARAPGLLLDAASRSAPACLLALGARLANAP